MASLALEELLDDVSAATQNVPPAWLQSHHLRDIVSGEIHARPFPIVEAPLRATFLAVLAGECGKSREMEHLTMLCRRFGLAPPTDATNFFNADLGAFTLRFERHTEFYTYTFLHAGEFVQPFAETALDFVPMDWLDALNGQVIVALHVAMQSRDVNVLSRDELHEALDNHRLIGSEVVEKNATLWTSLRIHSDGFGRFFIHDRALNECRAGRLLQRIFELETYRSLALLALPLARDFGPKISAFETQLCGIIESMAHAETLEDERKLLTGLLQLAAEIERLRAQSGYRFGAARAYSEIMTQRLEELRETQIEGLQTLGEFLERRFPTAMRTCETVNQRAASLSKRIDRATDLLRTRIDLTIEAQNQALLASMDKRAQMQLHLQETVEGFSIAAISYYTMGLVKYALNVLEAAGLALNHQVTTVLALPAVLAFAWWTTHRARRHLEQRKQQTHTDISLSEVRRQSTSSIEHP
jgi:uncharacterized membrane-anchored protein